MATVELRARLWLFHLKHLQGKRGQLSLHIAREACQYLADNPLLAHVTATFLRIFDIRASRWGPEIPLTTRIQADSRSKWAILEDGRVFACGGVGERTAYILERNGAVEVEECMQEARGWHGVIALHNAVYVFGGHNDDLLKTCEKYQLLNNTWSPLPAMQVGRCDFNPCMWLGVVYLCGNESMEAFTPDTFLPYTITLPEKSPCCVYVHNDLLVVNTLRYILKYAVGAEGQLVEESRLDTPLVDKAQNSHPVVARGLYFMVWKGKCLSVKMETGERASSYS